MIYMSKEELSKFIDVAECLESLIEIGKRDLTNPKYDGYFIEAKKALKNLKKERQ